MIGRRYPKDGSSSSGWWCGTNGASGQIDDDCSLVLSFELYNFYLGGFPSFCIFLLCMWIERWICCAQVTKSHDPIQFPSESMNVACSTQFSNSFSSGSEMYKHPCPPSIPMVWLWHELLTVQQPRWRGGRDEMQFVPLNNRTKSSIKK